MNAEDRGLPPKGLHPSVWQQVWYGEVGDGWGMLCGVHWAAGPLVWLSTCN